MCEKPPQTGNGAFWMTLVLLGVSFNSFAEGFFGELGKDAALALRDFVDELRAARSDSTLASDGWVEFDDPDETKVMIASGIPADAYRALMDLDWANARGGTIMRDEASKRWFDPTRPEWRP